MALRVMEERRRGGLTISTTVHKTVHKTDHSLVHCHSHFFLFTDITDVLQDGGRDEHIAGHVDSCIVTSGTYTKTASGSCLGRIQYRKESIMLFVMMSRLVVSLCRRNHGIVRTRNDVRRTNRPWSQPTVVVVRMVSTPTTPPLHSPPPRSLPHQRRRRRRHSYRQEA